MYNGIQNFICNLSMTQIETTTSDIKEVPFELRTQVNTVKQIIRMKVYAAFKLCLTRPLVTSTLYLIIDANTAVCLHLLMGIEVHVIYKI